MNLHLLSGSNIELLLIFLSFFAGRIIAFRESLYLLIFLLRLALWIVHKVPYTERVTLEKNLSFILKHVMRHHHITFTNSLKTDDEVYGMG